MKWSDIGKRFLAAASTVGLALSIASCGASNTIGFLYVTSNKVNPGQINVYEVDSESGALFQILDSPYPAGRNPVYEVAAPNGLSLYVANHDDNTIERFAIGTDGKLYPLQTVTTPGTEPVALALNASGTALYVLDYYGPAAPGQPSYTDLNPGPGSVSVYPVDPTTGALGTALSQGAANYWPVQCFPSNIAVTPDGGFVYVTNSNTVIVTTSPPVTGTVPILPATCPSSGTVSGFSVQASSSNGVQTVTGLTPVAGSPFTTGAGSAPTGITPDPDNASLYVMDSSLGRVDSYSIQAGGALSLATTVPSGNMPMNATIVTPAKTSNKFLYVSNYTDGSISIYTLQSGVPSPVTTFSSGTSGPLCLIPDPFAQHFLYIADYIGGRIGGEEIDPSTGVLVNNQNSPYPTSGQPTCVAAIPHAGNANGLQPVQ